MGGYFILHGRIYQFEHNNIQEISCPVMVKSLCVLINKAHVLDMDNNFLVCTSVCNFHIPYYPQKFLIDHDIYKKPITCHANQNCEMCILEECTFREPVLKIVVRVPNISRVDSRNNILISDESELLILGNDDIHKIPFSHNVIFVSSGWEHIVIIDDHRQIWSKGDNTYGQLGFDDTNVCQEFRKINVDDVMAVACDSYYSVILNSNGVVRCCGNNEYDLVYHQLNIIDIPNIIKIYASHDVCVLIDYNGDVFTSGYLYQNPSGSIYNFVKILELNNIEHIFINPNQIFAIDSQDVVYANNDISENSQHGFVEVFRSSRYYSQYKQIKSIQDT